MCIFELSLGAKFLKITVLYVKKFQAVRFKLLFLIDQRIRVGFLTRGFSLLLFRWCQVSESPIFLWQIKAIYLKTNTYWHATLSWSCLNKDKRLPIIKLGLWVLICVSFVKSVISNKKKRTSKRFIITKLKLRLLLMNNTKKQMLDWKYKL